MKASNYNYRITNLQQWLGLGLSMAGIAYYGLNTPAKQFKEVPQANTPIAEAVAIPQLATVEAMEDIRKDLNQAQVSAIFSKQLRKADKKKAAKLAQHLLSLAAQYHLSPSIILAVIQSESGFRFQVKSNASALGLMQIKPSTAAYISLHTHKKIYRRARDLYDPFINMSIGVAYLSYLRERFHNSVHYVAAYNLGPTTVSNMLRTNSFALGKVTKYVSEIHANARELRALSGTVLVAAQ